MTKKKNEALEAAVALRVLADSVGKKWFRLLRDDCTGLGHIHDLWNEMYRDMDAIVCLEKYIVGNTDGASGVDFGTPAGFEKYEVSECREEEKNG